MTPLLEWLRYASWAELAAYLWAVVFVLSTVTVLVFLGRFNARVGALLVVAVLGALALGSVEPVGVDGEPVPFNYTAEAGS